MLTARDARTVRVRGIVQGVGFRPYVYRLAHEHGLAGWVLNDAAGVEIHIEGSTDRLDAFVDALRRAPPPASVIAELEVESADAAGDTAFVIRESADGHHPTARMSPDLAVCGACLRELFDPGDLRYRYPYINCTDCGPRYSILLDLPYDRPNTTMRAWPLEGPCAKDYHDPASRRFHAQPVACAACGPGYTFRTADGAVVRDDAIARTAALLTAGGIVAIKGIGGYHLACDARNTQAVEALRERKFRKEKPFALMARDLAGVRAVADLSQDAAALLTSVARPIVVLPAREPLPGIAPDNRDVGVMLPYTPVHHLLFDAGAPELLVMTSANRSSEPIAYEDDDAFARLDGIADAFLVGERPIARRVEDSVVQCGPRGVTFLRRSRGHAPAAVATLPVTRPLLALGADLKNAITLVVDGQAFVSQHIGDLADYPAYAAFVETVADLVAMYGLRMADLTLVHDAHPQYVSTIFAAEQQARGRVAVQHHRAHIASVVAEMGAWDEPVLGMSLDGTGWGDDGTIRGAEVFAGSVRAGLERVAHLRPAALVGGDAAAEAPVQAAVGFVHQLDALPDLTAPPFDFPERYGMARQMLERDVRVFRTTSAGRLFDTAAALAGFTRTLGFEGQAAIWLEHLARGAAETDPYPFPFDGEELDWRPLLQSVVRDRMAGRELDEIARAFHSGIADGLAGAAHRLCGALGLRTVVCSGGVFQNQLLLDLLADRLDALNLELRINHEVPANDGGISLGQAALAGMGKG